MTMVDCSLQFFKLVVIKSIHRLTLSLSLIDPLITPSYPIMQKLIHVFAALEAYLHAHGSKCSLCPHY